MSTRSKPQAKPQTKPGAAPAQTASQSASNGKGKILLAALGLSGIGGALAMYALPIFLLLYGGFLPTLVAYLTDERRGKHLLISVATMNAAGVLLACRPLLGGSFSLDAGFAIVGNPSNWMTMYGFAMAGWVLVWLVPMVVSNVLEFIYSQRRRAAEVARDELVAQWPGVIGPAAAEDEEADEGKKSVAPASRPGMAPKAKPT
ncbi:MAG: hypothetical protein FJX66_03640 [Alphaproteobacteria bacterium]|nr:hypothetical protein [Alphaproteobacteria bacterium]